MRRHDRGLHREVVSDLNAAIASLIADERLGAVATVVAGPDIGAKAVVSVGTGIVAGSIPGEIAGDVLTDAEELMRHEQSRTLYYGDRRVFIETLAPPPVLLVFGAGHITQSLVRIAHEVGFRVVVSDARAAWATPERFPDVDRLIVGWPDAVFSEITIDQRTYTALLSHDARFEEPVLRAVHRSPVRYIGAMGSRRTHEQRKERLRGEGWTDDEIAAIHGPIGLDLGAETPAETAVSIVAEMIQARYGTGSGLSLLGTDGRIHTSRPEDGTSAANEGTRR